ncbi:LOW QUALITY PROTEIN: cell division control protein 45 homolog [Drosophila sulfurigaster albostrigata]|uniref:Cell division control protein 45 homolog n=1 Tax=Drosophila albomicans TaxID=7291 RepID=A0A6P8Y4A9_DROAB|nr:cell division control protein 45 homolog [Drosophila albomicans]XP_062141486.1 LOW QUALITY PROTEIN: cell division control protein 45 homolog [Drosophila sulfurigaster albostrigata]
MFIQDLKNDFYRQLIGKRILIIVNYDVDAICASKILQSLFKYDHMLYTVVPIMGLTGLRRAYNEHQGDVKYVLLVNCGGCVDIVELLQPAEDVTFYICDSHRPFDVCNVYSDRQVCLLGDPALEENIPAFESIFYDSDGEDDDDEDEEHDGDEHEDSGAGESDGDADGGNAVERRRAPKLSRLERHEQRIMRQRARRQWELERDRIMFDYTQFSYYGRSTALLIFELAWKLSKDNMDLLWWAIVGISEQLLLGKIESGAYTLELEHIQSHVSRLTNKTNDQNTMSASKITFENDLHLVLYRHWTVTESMRYSRYSACQLKLWTLRGEKRLHELLVEMGLPLVHARQTYSAMDLVLRKEFYTMVEQLAEKYAIPDIVYGTFTLSYGYRSRYAAADYVYALLAILQSIKKHKTPEDCFMEASDALTRQHKQLLNAGIDNAKLLHAAIFRQVQSCLEAHQVHSTGSFFYYVLQEEHAFFSYPYALALLAKFVLHGHVATTRARQAPDLPLIATCPLDAAQGMCLLVGIAPVREDSPKNFFGKAFDQAAQKSKTSLLQDFFEPSIVQLRQSDLTRFLDALTVLLT